MFEPSEAILSDVRLASHAPAAGAGPPASVGPLFGAGRERGGRPTRLFRKHIFGFFVPRAPRVANAGCVTPIIRRAGGAVEWVEAGGVPLGAGLGAHRGYPTITRGLSSGDMVILTSDGPLLAAADGTGCLSEPFPSCLCVAELQYMDGLGELSGVPGAAPELAENPPGLELRVRALTRCAEPRVGAVASFCDSSLFFPRYGIFA